MRATRNWGLIRSGETFEALATTLISFEDPNSRLFGRRGRDGGQDARSGDGKTVYQAKHHQSPTAAKAIADAKAEAVNVAKYRKVKHPRHAQWKGVKNWVLVTNASFNPTDDQIWKDDVVPLFAKLGLTATYWEEATLDGYLDKHPEVDRSFFQGQSRIFLSPAEACLEVASIDGFVGRAELAPYVGREADLAELDAFLASEKTFLQVHAAGGIGKTRFLLEGACQVAAQGQWQGLWANVQSMAASSNWFDAVVPERPTLLIVDEPDDERLVQRLQEQLGGRVGRAQQWRIAMAVRSANDPILRALQDPKRKHRVQELLLKPLARKECEEMCSKLMETGRLATAPLTWRNDVANALASRFDGYPIWLSLAIHLLEKDGSLANLPDNAGSLCRKYLGEVLDGGDGRKELLPVLRWVALLGPVNREDKSQLEHLAERAGGAGVDAVEQALMRLTSTRLLRRWGARDRLVDVKPDVLRDFLVRDWLCEERDYGDQPYVPSAAARVLVDELTKSMMFDRSGPREERMLAALARTDFMLRHGDNPPRLGAPLFVALNTALPGMTPSQRIAVVEKLQEVGAYYPQDVLGLLRRLRLEVAADETVQFYQRSRRYSQSDVVLKLAGAHQKVARGILTDEQRGLVVGELLELYVEEARVAPALKYGLPNDGRRAADVARNLLENGPGYVHEFGDVAADVVLDRLSTSALAQSGALEMKAIETLVKHLCHVQRHQTWSDGPKLHFGAHHLHSNHPNMVGRARVLKRIRCILEDREEIDEKARVALWNMLSEAHTGLNYARGQVGPKHKKYSSELSSWLVDDLMWVKSVLASGRLSMRELRAARRVWHWHAEHGEGRCHAIAKEVEKFYRANPVVDLFESLTSWDDMQATQAKVESKAKALASGTTADLETFLADAEGFLGPEDMRRVNSVAYALGRGAIERVPIRRFLVRELRTGERTSARYSFVLSAVHAWVHAQRREDQNRAAKLVEELLNLCGEEKKLELLRMFYGGSPSPPAELITSKAECGLVRGYQELFIKHGAISDFVRGTLWGMQHDWPGLKTCIEQAFTDAREQRSEAMAVLIDELQEILCREDEWSPPDDLLRWLWDQVVATPDFDHFKYNHGWNLDQIVGKLGKVPITWLPEALRIRAAQPDDEDLGRTDSPSCLLPLLAPLSEETVGDLDVQDAVAKLCALLVETPLMRHWLPELLARLDPLGLEVPHRIAAMAEQASLESTLRPFCKVALYYGVGTPAWRRVARTAFQTAASFSKEEREDVYDSVSETGRMSWQSEVGKVPQIFIDAVEAAERGLTEETEDIFVPFWRWRLERKKDELRRQEEDLKEEVWD